MMLHVVHQKTVAVLRGAVASPGKLGLPIAGVPVLLPSVPGEPHTHTHAISHRLSSCLFCSGPQEDKGGWTGGTGPTMLAGGEGDISAGGGLAIGWGLYAAVRLESACQLWRADRDYQVRRSPGTLPWHTVWPCCSPPPTPANTRMLGARLSLAIHVGEPMHCPLN